MMDIWNPMRPNHLFVTSHNISRIHSRSLPVADSPINTPLKEPSITSPSSNIIACFTRIQPIVPKLPRSCVQTFSDRSVCSSLVPELFINKSRHLYAQLIHNSPQGPNDMSEPQQLESTYEMDTFIRQVIVLHLAGPASGKISEEWRLPLQINVQKVGNSDAVSLVNL
ncbi:hypothetical protein HG530_010735 [Fusarium avenaceum]|nr:hypothetical protein HG530_010735 [Fusarium avenaceum]